MIAKKLFFVALTLMFFPVVAWANSPMPDTNININDNNMDQNQGQWQGQGQGQEQTAIGIGGNQEQQAASFSASGSEANSYGSSAFSGGSSSDANSVSSVEESGNADVTLEYPVNLVGAQMIAPVVLDNQIFSFIAGRKVVDGIPVLFVDQRNYAAVRFAISSAKIGILGSAQDHGKKFLATLHSRVGEYLGPWEQAEELVAEAPEGTACVLVEIQTVSHTRGAGGAAGGGEHSSGGITSSIAANLAGSMAVPVTMTTATYLDTDLVVINCNDPSQYGDPLCQN